MFTGIVTHTGTVQAAESGNSGGRLEIKTDAGLGAVEVGASIACSGVCLTVSRQGKGWFGVDVSAETLARTTISGWGCGARINLERPLKVGDELGGHFVLGHVDGVAEITGCERDGDSALLTVAALTSLAACIAKKGSVTLDGVSLTVNESSGSAFGVNLIPHTLAVTTLGDAETGVRVNLEVDPLARYVGRLKEADE